MSVFSKLLSVVRKFKPNVNEATAKQIENCAEDDLEQEYNNPNNKINNGDNVSERNAKMASDLASCGQNMVAEDENGKVGEPFSQDPCMTDKMRLLLEEMTESMGMGIDENTPFQEGFIPPHCYEHANTILNAVRKDALFGNKGSKVDTNYNSSAVLLDDVIREMRDFHEVSKFLMTVQDNSEGCKKMMDNTVNNLNYKQIYMNKDLLDFRDSVFDTKRKTNAK